MLSLLNIPYDIQTNIKKVAPNLYLVKSKSKQDVVYTVDMTIGRCPAGNYMFKVNKRNTKTRCEICSKLTIKIPEHISHLVLVFLLLTLSM